MVWVRCRAEPCKLDGSTAQTIGTNLGRVAERERSVGGHRRQLREPPTVEAIIGALPNNLFYAALTGILMGLYAVHERKGR